MFTQITIPAQVTKVDLPARDKQGRKKRQQKFLLGFGNCDAIKYLFFASSIVPSLQMRGIFDLGV